MVSVVGSTSTTAAFAATFRHALRVRVFDVSFNHKTQATFAGQSSKSEMFLRGVTWKRCLCGDQKILGTMLSLRVAFTHKFVEATRGIEFSTDGTSGCVRSAVHPSIRMLLCVARCVLLEAVERVFNAT